MGILNDLTNWLTGRNSDLYNNPQKVEAAIASIQNIQSNEIEDARSSIYAAINEINKNIEYVGHIDPKNYDPLFDSIGEGVKYIGDVLQNKSDEIKAYNESSGWEKLGSSIFMGIFKVGEGVLSVAEELGDGVFSVVGWLAPKDSGLEKACESIINKNWSRDVFSGYYDSEFAKASIFTEDSAIAGGFKLVGKTAGYLFATGYATKIGTRLASKGASLVATEANGVAGLLGKGAGKVLTGTAKVGAKLASSTTWGATTTAALGGLGSGTETAIHSGKSMDDAFGEGMKTAAIAGGLAFAGGKIGEKLQKNAAVKEMEKAADQAAEQADNAVNQVDDLLKDAEKSLKEAEDALSKANKNLNQKNNLVNKLKDESESLLEQAQAKRDAVLAKYDASDIYEIGHNAEIDDLHAAYDAYSKSAKALDVAKSDADGALQAFKDAHKTQLSRSKRVISLTGEKDTLQAIGELRKNANQVVLDGVKNAKLSQFQGYDNALTRLGAGGTLEGVTLATMAGKGVVKEAGKEVVKEAGKEVAKDAGKLTAKEVLQKAGGVVALAAGNVIKETGVPGVIEGNSDTKEVGKMWDAVKKVDDSGVETFYTQKNLETPRSTPELKPTNLAGQDRETGIEDDPTKTTDLNNKTQQTDSNTNTQQTIPSENSTPTQIDPKTEDTPKPIEPTTTDDDNTIKPIDPEPTEIEPIKPVDPTPTDDDNTIKPIDPQPTEIEPIKPIDPTPTNDDNTIKPIDPEPREITPDITTKTPQDTTTSTFKPSDLTTSLNNGTSSTSNTGTSTGGGSNWSGHTGGGYSSTGGYTSGEEPVVEELLEETVEEPVIEELVDETDASIDEIIKGKVTKIPTTTVPIQAKPKTTGSTAIPIAAGLSAAAAAGIGAKAYMDHKKNNDNGEEDEFYSDEWEEDDTIQIDSDSSENDNNTEKDYLTPDDEYSFAQEEEVERYGARKNDELADLQ